MAVADGGGDGDDGSVVVVVAAVALYEIADIDKLSLVSSSLLQWLVSVSDWSMINLLRSVGVNDDVRWSSPSVFSGESNAFTLAMLFSFDGDK